MLAPFQSERKQQLGDEQFYYEYYFVYRKIIDEHARSPVEIQRHRAQKLLALGLRYGKLAVPDFDRRVVETAHVFEIDRKTAIA